MENQSSINVIEIGKCKYELPLEDISPDGNHEDWVRVGRAIYDASDGSDYGLAVFYDWSRQGRKHKIFKEIEDIWQSFSIGEKISYPHDALVMLGAKAVDVEPELYQQILQQRMTMEFLMKKTNTSIYVPWHEEEKIKSGELKPCESSTEIEFDGCSVTIRLDCDAQDVDCNNCPVKPGWENLLHVRW
jgi:hypothetical protein